VRRKPKKETDAEGFTERSIMALVIEAAEIKETTLRIVAMVAALASAHGISSEV
jgi:hypothetical protein